MLKHILTFIIVCLMITACANQVTNVPARISTSTSAPSLGAHFPQTTIQLGNTDMLVRGELTLDNDCLRVSGTNTINGDSYLLIWDSTFSTRTEQGVVQVIDSLTGEALASIGDYIEVGGGVVVATREVEMALKEPIPK